ncbi:MAG: hypothetical protein ABGY24_01760, partial [bacterium]
MELLDVAAPEPPPPFVFVEKRAPERREVRSNERSRDIFAFVVPHALVELGGVGDGCCGDSGDNAPVDEGIYAYRRRYASGGGEWRRVSCERTGGMSGTFVFTIGRDVGREGASGGDPGV